MKFTKKYRDTKKKNPSLQQRSFFFLFSLFFLNLNFKILYSYKWQCRSCLRYFFCLENQPESEQVSKLPIFYLLINFFCFCFLNVNKVKDLETWRLIFFFGWSVTRVYIGLTIFLKINTTGCAFSFFKNKKKKI